MFILQLFTARHDRVTGHTNSIHTPVCISISGIFTRLRTTTAKENGAAVLDKLAREIWRRYKAYLNMGEGLERDSEGVKI